MPELTAIPFRVKAFGEEMLVASAIDDDLGTFAGGQATSSGLQGEADEAYLAERERIGGVADASSLALRAVADQVLEHAAQLDRLRIERAALVARYDDLAHLAASLGDPNAAVSGPAHLDSALAGAAVDDYETDRAAWMRRLAAAESAMIAGLRAVMTLDEARVRYAGVPDPADGVVGTIPPSGAPPAAVAGWWGSLSRAEREALVAADPEAIGNRDGIPAWARDRADVVLLQRDLQELGEVPPGDLTPEQRTRLANALAAQDALARMHDATDPLTGGHYPTQLYLYEPDAFGGDGEVAIALGDLDTARNIAVTVPGFGTDAGSAPAQSAKAIDVQQAAGLLGDGRTDATMFWIGYDAPDNRPWGEGGADAAGVLTDRMARAGGHRLAAAVDGLTQMRPSKAHLSVIGHSYGSTTAALGASYSPPGEIGDLVLVGSPGAGQEIHDAADTGVSDGHVWDGRNSGDPIARLGDHGALGLQSTLGAGLGTDPASEGFGAQRFEAESTSRGDGTAIADHLKYFDHDTESLANMARIVDGDYAQVIDAPPVHDPLLPHPERHLRSIGASALGLVGDVVDTVAHPSHGVHDVVNGLLHLQDVVGDVVGGPVDPERDRPPTAPDTDGR